MAYRIGSSASREGNLARRVVLVGEANRAKLRSAQWLEPRVKLVGDAPATPHERLYGAVLASQGCASHRATAWLCELDGFELPIVELTVPRRSGYRRHVTHHADLERVDTTMVDGIRCTTATRTIIDLGAVVDADAVWRAFESAVRKGLTSAEYLERRLDRLSRKGRPGLEAARSALERHAGVTASELERLFLKLCRSYRLPRPELQHQAGTYFIDYAYPERKLAIELDGYAHHSDRNAFGRDRTRQNWLVLNGWTVLRFTWEDITKRPDPVAQIVLRAIAA